MATSRSRSHRTSSKTKYQVGQCFDFTQRHCGRDLPFTGEVIEINVIQGGPMYHVLVTHSDGTLFALVRESQIIGLSESGRSYKR